MSIKVKPGAKSMAMIATTELKVWAAATGNGDGKRANKARNELAKRGVSG